MSKVSMCFRALSFDAESLAYSRSPKKPAVADCNSSQF